MTTRQIKNLIEKHFEIDISSKCREYEYIKIRFLYCHYAYYYSNNLITYAHIGNLINRTHATVIHALKEYHNLIYSDKVFQKEVNAFHELFMQEKKKTSIENDNLFFEDIDKLELKRMIQNLRYRVKTKKTKINNLKAQIEIKDNRIENLTMRLNTSLRLNS